MSEIDFNQRLQRQVFINGISEYDAQKKTKEKANEKRTPEAGSAGESRDEDSLAVLDYAASMQKVSVKTGASKNNSASLTSTYTLNGVTFTVQKKKRKKEVSLIHLMATN